MLDYMRKNVGSWFIKILLFGIAIVFAFWGVGSYTNRDTNVVLTIDKVRIPYSEYRDIYNTLVESYRQVYERLDSDTIALLDIKGQALETLMERYLLLEAADRLNITASPDEVAAELAATESLFENGVFSPQRYQAFLDYNRITRESFESTLARDLTIRKVRGVIALSAVVTPQEVDENLDLLTREITARILKLDPNRFIRELAPAGEEELLDYFDENIEQYRVPEKFTAAVVILDPRDTGEKMVVSMEDIEEWYEEREEEYTEEAAYKLRHILFTFPAEATAENIGEVRVKAEEVATDLREGELTFEEAARKFSDDDQSAGAGGILGFVAEGDLEPALAGVAANLGEGEVSDPIPTSKGFEIIGVLEIKEERLVPLEEVRDTIEARLKEEKAFDATYDAADDLLARAEGADVSLEEAAQELELTVVITPPFSRGLPPSTVELPDSLIDAVYTTEEGEVGDIYEKDGRLYLFQTVKRTESYLPELDDVREEVNAGLLVRRALDRAHERGEEMLARIVEGASLDTLAGEIRETVEDTPPFSVLERSLPGIADAEELIMQAFAIPEVGGAVLVEGDQGHYLVVLKEILPPDEELRAQQRKTIEDALRAQREQDMVSSYLDSLKAEYADRIVVNTDLI